MMDSLMVNDFISTRPKLTYQELFLKRHIILFLQNPNGLSEWCIFYIFPWDTISYGVFWFHSLFTPACPCPSATLFFPSLSDRVTHSSPLWPLLFSGFYWVGQEVRSVFSCKLALVALSCL